MYFDITAIVACAVLVLLALWSSLSDTLRRKVVGDCDEGISDDVAQPVSVIVISDNDADSLASNLPVFLSQDYPAGYEVIVVVDRDEDGTADVLKSFNDSGLLYTTFVPKSSRYMSRRKLAITLGVKAAKNELVLLTDASARPVSSLWIKQMCSSCRRGVEIVIGYSNFAQEVGHFKRFYRFHRAWSYLHDAASGTAYSMAGCNLMFRKGMFMSGNGFLGNLKYIRGEYEFLVNKYSNRTNVAVTTAPGSYIMEKAPSLKKWHDMNVFHVETRRHLTKGFRHHAAYFSDMLSLHVCLLASIVAVAWSIVASLWLVLPFAVAALIVPLFLRALAARRVMAFLGESLPSWQVIPFEMYLVCHDLKYVLLHKLSDKQEFISHKS